MFFIRTSIVSQFEFLVFQVFYIQNASIIYPIGSHTSLPPVIALSFLLQKTHSFVWIFRFSHINLILYPHTIRCGCKNYHEKFEAKKALNPVKSIFGSRTKTVANEFQ